VPGLRRGRSGRLAAGTVAAGREQAAEQGCRQQEPATQQRAGARPEPASQPPDLRQQPQARAAVAALGVATDGGAEEHARPLRGQRLVHEPEHETVAQQRAEARLVLADTCHDHDHVRELVHDLPE